MARTIKAAGRRAKGNAPVRGILMAVALLAPAAGCRGRPHAPALRDGPIFQNSSEGIRFRVPEGWTRAWIGPQPSASNNRRALGVPMRCLTTPE